MIRVLQETTYNSAMIKLKGMAWDHPRGYDPLIAVSNEFSKINPNVSISWDVRSLKEFGDMPVESLIIKYDLITIDHPYMGQADKNGLLQKLEAFISTEVLEKLENQSVGPSYKSYHYKNHIYALPIDAAALVAAYRKDIIDRLHLTLPSTQEDLKYFYGKLPDSYTVAWALCPTDFWCTFLTLCAQHAGQHFINNRLVNKEVGAKALDEIKCHLEFLHPESMNWNPIQILDRMGTDEEIAYSPYLFGYTNYSRSGYTKNLIHFSNSPIGRKNTISTILGGVGLAVSSQCKNLAAAASFVEFTASAEIQNGIFTRNGGQPGNIQAWKSKENNQLCNNFFTNTLETLEKAYVRPQHPGWNRFQEQGADLLHDGILKNRNTLEIMEDLNSLYQSIEQDEKV